MSSYLELRSLAEQVGCLEMVAKAEKQAEFLLEQNHTNIVITGERGSGKTRLINYLVGFEVWEEGHMDDYEKPLRVAFEPLPNDERFNCLMAANHQWHTEAAVLYELREEDILCDGRQTEYLENMDVVLYLISARAPFSSNQVNALRALRPLKRYVVLTGLETVDPKDQDQVLEYVDRFINSLNLPPVIVWREDAKQDLGRTVRNVLPAYEELHRLRTLHNEHNRCNMIAAIREKAKALLEENSKALSEAADAQGKATMDSSRERREWINLLNELREMRFHANDTVTAQLSSECDSIVRAIVNSGHEQYYSAEWRNKAPSLLDNKLRKLIEQYARKALDTYFNDIDLLSKSAKSLRLSGYQESDFYHLREIAEKEISPARVGKISKADTLGGPYSFAPPAPGTSATDKAKVLIGTGAAVGFFTFAALTENMSKSETDSESYGEGASKSIAETSGKTAQVSYVNKSVTDLLARLELQIQEMTKLENTGAFRAGAYFIAADMETASSAASIYRSITTSANASAKNSPVYCWSDPQKVKIIRENLMYGEHPEFAFEEHPEYPNVSAAQPISLQDIPVFLCMPQKSVYGITVTEHAAFARDILLRNKTRETAANQLDIGCIYHMGKENRAIPVKLNTNTLTSHLFVAGATGTGKSNFCYHLIDQLVDAGVKCLVIEPAKGEYRKVFGGREDFHVYGTNLKITPPLRINPFAFPAGITASEHIERLMSIFCAAWPMYSAMPAIMKDALEAIYREKGFDEIWGELPVGGSFPKFSDLLNKLPEIIKESKYSQEVQGNYIGALVTRVKSLTNGIYSILFTENELSDQELFDENTIIDISRIGSEETKAFIMGVLITRLEEYRSCSGLMNSTLRHVTLLEEAHHLLGSHGTSQSQDFGNMRGASIEMINNAIREMRTYGEGFMIADQSPSAIDGSVISNTQTKVFFMMPAREDRTIVGDVTSLTEKQRNEIVKLPCGVAMVWQNEWTDAVLCKIRYFSPDKYVPFSYPVDVQLVSRYLLTSAVKLLLHERTKKPLYKTERFASLQPEEMILKPN